VNNHHVEITGWRQGLKKVSLTEALHNHAGLGLAAAKDVTDRVLAGESVKVSVQSLEAAETLSTRLESLGALSRVQADDQPHLDWQVWRQDDNGNKSIINSFASESEALAILAQYESRHHKQTYWIVRASGNKT